MLIYNQNNIKQTNYSIQAQMFVPSGSLPLDNRSVVQSATDLENIETFLVNGAFTGYIGMVVLVQDSPQKLFTLINTDVQATYTETGSDEEKEFIYPVTCASNNPERLGYPINRNMTDDWVEYCIVDGDNLCAIEYINGKTYKVIKTSNDEVITSTEINVTSIKYGTWVQLSFPNEQLPHVPVYETDASGSVRDVAEQISKQAELTEQKTFATTGNIKRYIDNSLSWNKIKVK